ncbi:hypothetical protein ABEF95_012376 [Exophiala dermatitidis]
MEALPQLSDQLFPDSLFDWDPVPDDDWFCANAADRLRETHGPESGLRQSPFPIASDMIPLEDSEESGLESDPEAERACRTLLSKPEIDMSTALSLCRTRSEDSAGSDQFARGADHHLDSVYDEFLPNLYTNQRGPSEPPILTDVPPALIQELGRILPRALRDEVVVLYFRHVHPLCPIVDEFEFARIYRECEREEDLFSRFDVMLFLAMMFVAFAHVGNSALEMSSASTVVAGQKALLEHVKSLYKNSSTYTNQTTLTCTCLLLSYWSPFDLDTQVNSRWVHRAFFHARQARLGDPDFDSGTMFSRRKIIWWSCVLRDRLVSVGLRRLHRLHKIESRWGPVTTADFGAEAVCPQFMGVESKRVMMSAFIWMCNLIPLICGIGTFHANRKFQWEWRDVSSANHDLLLEELMQCSAYESQLKEWKTRFKQELGFAMVKESAEMSRVPLRFPQLVNLSLFAALYRPYLKCNLHESPLGVRFRTLAATKVKEASAKVVKTVHQIFSESKVEHVPLAVTAWIALPLAVCEVDWHATGGQSSCLTVSQRSEIMISLNALAERLCGVKPTYQLLSWVATLASSQESSHVRATKRARLDLEQLVTQSPEGTPHTEDEDSYILDLVAGAVDLSLSSDEKPSTVT